MGSIARLVEQERQLVIDHHAAVLRDGSATEREISVVALSRFGDAAVEPLCAALLDSDLNVRLAAVKALGEMGDERAIEPLTQALQALSISGSARRQRLRSLLALVIIPILAIVLLVTTHSAGFIGGLVMPVIGFVSERRERSRRLEVFLTALSRVTQRCPSPRLRHAATELREMSGDPFWHEKAARKASAAAAERIEQAMSELKSLPVAAASPALQAEHLPISASSHEREETAWVEVRT